MVTRFFFDRSDLECKIEHKFTSNGPLKLIMYRVIHKSLRDFRPLRYSSRDGHAEGEHVNRGRDTPNFCPTLQVLDMCTCKVGQKLGVSLPLLTCSPSA
jgi:hypothetical protein